MAKIKLTMNWGPHRRGDVVEMDDAEALDLLDGKMAVVVRDEPDVEGPDDSPPAAPDDDAVVADPEDDPDYGDDVDIVPAETDEVDEVDEVDVADSGFDPVTTGGIYDVEDDPDSI